MDIYSTEEEQAEAIKKWLKANVPAIVIGIALGFGGLKGWEYWQQKQIQGSATASAEYEAQVLQIETTEIPELEAQLAAYKTRNESIIYNNFLQLKLAKRAVESGDFDVASTSLNEIIAEPGNDAIKHTAIIRLARVLLANDKADDAIALLNRDAESYKQLYSQIRGDAYFAKGEIEKARQAYLMAKGDDLSANNNLQMKIDNLAVLEVPLTDVLLESNIESPDAEAKTESIEIENEATQATDNNNEEEKINEGEGDS